jgi:hypothetical protein
MNTGTEKLTLSEKIDKLGQFMEENDYSLTHFLVSTELKNSDKHEMGRIAKEFIPAGTLIAIIGGVFIDYVDQYIAMPLGSGLYMHQVRNNRKGTINHSCDPNCIMRELNKLTAMRDIEIGEELNIDYGTAVAGKGYVTIADCKCGSSKCRHIITSHDYLTLPNEILSGLALAVKRKKL